MNIYIYIYDSITNIYIYIYLYTHRIYILIYKYITNITIRNTHKAAVEGRDRLLLMAAADEELFISMK